MTMCSRQSRTPGPDRVFLPEALSNFCRAPGPDRVCFASAFSIRCRTRAGRAGRVVKRDRLSQQCRARAGRAGLLILSKKCPVLRARAKIIYHFGISASGDLWPILIRKALEIACYSCGFAQSDRPNP